MATGLLDTGRMGEAAVVRRQGRATIGYAGGILVALAFAAAPVVAQSTVAPGTVVRIESPRILQYQATGRVAEGPPGSVSLELPGGQRLTIPRSEIRSLEVADGVRRATLRGAFVGLLLGMALGEGITAQARANDRIDPACGELDCFSDAFVPGMTLAGGVVGGLVGSRFRITVWRRVSVSVEIGSGAGAMVRRAAGAGDR